MKLRARITVDTGAASYIDAATHQERLETFLQRVKKDYPNAQLTIRERRERLLHSNVGIHRAHIVPLSKARP